MPDALSRETWMRLHGSPSPPPERLELRAGPLSMVFEPELAFLRYVRAGDHEALRGVYAAVRDRNWGTVPPRVRSLEVERGPDSFRVTFDVECREGEIDFGWRGELTGTADGVVTYRFEGEARSTFLRNRIGFCVLHPDSCLGKPLAVEHVDGSVEQAEFPRAISPHQPFRDIRALTHMFAPGKLMQVRMEGDVFEMEDQRNWTDASYKTYCTPLDLPYPVEITAGTRVSQQITLRLDGTLYQHPAEAETGTGPVWLLEDPGDPLPLPRIGLQMAAESPPLSGAEIERLRALRLSHLRVDLRLSDPEYADRLDEALRVARELGAGLEIALFLPAGADDELARLAAHPGLGEVSELAWLIYPERGKAAGPAELELARKHLARGRILGGTDAYFTELNRNRPAAALLDGVCYSINPQVHAFDDASLAETLETQAATVASARALYSGKRVHVSPVTFKPRYNPDATGPTPEPLPGELPANVDPRQMSLFGAGWTLGSLKHLSEGGVDSVTLYETAGWRGVMERDAGSPLPERFPSTPGGVFPLYHVLRAFGEFRGGEIVPLTSSDPLQVQAALLRRNGRETLLVANLTGETQAVCKSERWKVPARAQWLNDETYQHAALEPEAFARGWRPLHVHRGGQIQLPPYAVVRVEPVEGSGGA